MNKYLKEEARYTALSALENVDLDYVATLSSEEDGFTREDQDQIYGWVRDIIDYLGSVDIEGIIP